MDEEPPSLQWGMENIDTELLGEQGKGKESLPGIARTGQVAVTNIQPAPEGCPEPGKPKPSMTGGRETNTAGCDYPGYTSLSNLSLD